MQVNNSAAIYIILDYESKNVDNCWFVYFIYIDFSFYSYSICLSMLGEGQQSKVRQSDPSKRFGIFREYLVMSVLH